MKKTKTILVCVIALGLAYSVFASGSRDQGKAPVADVGFNPTGMPIVSKPFTFSAVQLRRPMHAPYNDMEVFQKMERETGVHVQWIEIPEANFRERLNLTLASNDLPDVFMHGLTDSDILRYGQSGALIPMENLIEQYAPRIKKLFGDRPEIKKYVTTPDNHIYILPRLQELAYRVNPDNWFINKIWLDKLGLKAPETFDEFYSVLRAFKERDPNGNGKRDEIPFTFMGKTVGGSFDIASLFAGFGMSDTANHISVANKKAYFTANTQQFKDALTYFNKLYVEGLVDPEAFTHDVKQYTAKGMAPEMLYGVFFDWFDENTVGVERAKNDYIMLPPLKGIDGKQHWNEDPYGTLARENFAITSKMKNPEVAIRWADYCYDRDLSIELCSGPFDVVLRKEGDRIITIPPPPGMSNDEFRYLHTAAHTTPFAINEYDFKYTIISTENVVRKLDRFETYRKYFPPREEIYPKVFFLQEEEEELAILRTDITDYVSQMRAKFIIGSESLTSGWNTYVQALNQMGLPRYVELHQKALDRYNSN
jgi:putative aldouronate transport system substrate-binding protein